METSIFLGTENRVLLTASETEGTVGVIDISVQPGAGAPLHTNTREALMWYVVDGLLTFQTEQDPVGVAARARLAAVIPRRRTAPSAPKLAP